MDDQGQFHPASREAAAERARQLAFLDIQTPTALVGRLPNGDTVEVERLGPIVLAGDRDPWERQPGELDSAWDAFVVYRNLPPGRRTINATWNILHPERQVGRDIAQAGVGMATWATQYRWSDRATAYDMYQDQLFREYLEGQRLKARVETADLGEEMRSVAAEALAAFKAITYVKVKDKQTGETKVVRRSTLSVRDIVALAEAGVKIQRLALGEQDGGGPRLAVGVKVQLGDEELVEKASAIIAARQGGPVTIDQL